MAVDPSVSKVERRLPPPLPAVSVEVSRRVTVKAPDGKPALELVNTDGEVSVTVLPKNGGKRQPITLDDLKRAVQALEA